jgi:hypothetical protein
MSHLLPIIGKVSSDYWWLTDWASAAQFQVSCPVRVEWFLPALYDTHMPFMSRGISHDSHISRASFQNIYTKAYPDWTCGVPTPNHGETLRHHWGLSPWPKVPCVALQQTVSCAPPFLHKGVPWLDKWDPSPQLRRNTLAPEGFEPLTKGSATLNPLYPSTWGVWTPDQGFYEQPSNQLYPMVPTHKVIWINQEPWEWIEDACRALFC